MAQREHVDVLKSGSDAILEWRGQHIGIPLDATGADLTTIDLSDAPLSGAILSGMKGVDQAIRLYDKQLVILSEQSLKSEPVIREIERALQKETRD